MPTYLSPGVYVEEVDRGSKPIEGVGTAVAAYGGFVEGALLPHAVYGYFNNGGGTCYVCRIPNTSGGGGAPTRALPSGAKGELQTLEVRALEAGGALEVTVEPQAAAEGEQPSTFTLKVLAGGREVESFSDLTFGKGNRNVETVVNTESRYVRVKAPQVSGATLAERIPAAGSYPLEAGSVTPIEVSGGDFEGSETDRTGIRGLVIADEVTMVVVPDLVTASTRNGRFDLDMFKAVQTAMITHCENAGDRMAILDSPPGMNPQQIKDWRSGVAMYDSRFAALYYPWIKVANPLSRDGGMLTVPPSGHIAGIWARNDDTRGVWKAPANEVIRGALDLDRKSTRLN